MYDKFIIRETSAPKSTQKVSHKLLVTLVRNILEGKGNSTLEPRSTPARPLDFGPPSTTQNVKYTT